MGVTTPCCTALTEQYTAPLVYTVIVYRFYKLFCKFLVNDLSDYKLEVA